MGKMGRPTKYSKTIADTICKRMAHGESVRAICRDKKMPCLSSVMKWLTEQEYFSEQYTYAQECRAEYWAEEILEISDDSENDTSIVGEGDEAKAVTNKEVVARSRLRVDTRKWLMSKLKSKKYGEKLDVNHGGNLTVNVIKFGDESA